MNYRVKIVLVLLAWLILICVVSVIQFYLTSFFYRMIGFEPSYLVSHIINSVAGITLLISIVMGIGYITRSKRRNFFLPLIEALRKIGKGDFNVDLTSKKQYRGPMRILASNIHHLAKELNEMERMRQEFISNVSHEIQSPLTSINGFAHVLRNDNLSIKERNHYLDIIDTESKRLSRLSDNLLKLTSLDAEKPQFEIEQFRLDQQLKNVLLVTEPQWQSKGLDIEVNVQKTTIKGDRELLSQVWLNIIHNAIKFTPEGGSISVGLKQNSGNIEVSIRDNGIGISEKEQDHIFERFYKADPSRDRSKGGSGLGLAIVKKIIDLHKGSIIVRSMLGEGTTFIVHLR